MFFGVGMVSLKGASFATGVLCVHHASHRNAWWDVLTPQPGMDNLGPPPSCHTRMLVFEVHPATRACLFSKSMFVRSLARFSLLLLPLFPFFLPAVSSRFHPFALRPASLHVCFRCWDVIYLGIFREAVGLHVLRPRGRYGLGRDERHRRGA